MLNMAGYVNMAGHVKQTLKKLKSLYFEYISHVTYFHVTFFHVPNGQKIGNSYKYKQHLKRPKTKFYGCFDLKNYSFLLE